MLVRTGVRVQIEQDAPAFELVPDDFEVPDGLAHDRFRLRMLTVDDVVQGLRLAPDESRVLGCVYLNPTETHDVRVKLWVRNDAYADELDPVLEEAVREWVATRWPFERVSFAERDR